MSRPASPSPSSTSSFLPTTTLLAIPDGPIASSSKDSRTHTISIMGGYPTFPSLPAASHSKIPSEIACGNCSQAIPLLTQVYCPPEGGENDRNVYVFGCPRGQCQRKEGSIRAYRASVLNEAYAADAAEQKAKREKEEAERKEKDKINPFSAGNTLSSAAGSLGSALFGNAPSSGGAFNPFAASSPTEEPPVNAFSSLTLSATSPASPKKATKVQSGPETPAKTFSNPFPAYLPAQYLATFEEFLPADPDALAADTASKVKQLSAEEAAETEKKIKSGTNTAAGAEQWERVLPKGVDEVFEKFLERLNRAEDGEGQVLRYDLGAIPLPYSSKSDLYKKMFKKAGAEEDDEDDEPGANIASKLYDPSGLVPPCPRCGSERTFEMQLVPGLIAELKTESLSLTGEKAKKSKKNKKQTDEERRMELAVLLGRATAKAPVVNEADEQGKTDLEKQEDRLRNETGMEWGTVMVFGCAKDCVGFGEEWVGVEWEDIQ